MSAEFTYFRKYIILKNDHTNIDGINPKGHGKIEIKGNKGVISLSVENCEKEEEYALYFLNKRKDGIEENNIGRIITDDSGRSRTNITFDLRDLRSKDLSIDKIDAILIRRDIYILLSTYMDKNNGVIEQFIGKLTVKDEQEIFTRPTIVEEPEETLEQEVESEEVEEEMLEQEVESEEVVEGAIPELEIQEELEELPEPELEPELEEPKETLEPEIKSIQDPFPTQTYQSLEYNRQLNHKNQMTNYILSILRFFPQVQPLKMYLHGYSWWRIDDDGTDSYKGFLPYYNYLMSSDYKYPFLRNATTCLNQIKKHGHYLFGLYKERETTKYYIYGIPGNFTIGEHPFKGVTGFNTWYESIDGIGYWILYIDPLTGKVIYPINPMVPSR